MARLTILFICVSLAIKFALPQISFAREWVRSKYTTDGSSEAEVEVPTKVRRLMASHYNSKFYMPLPRSKGKTQWPIASTVTDASAVPVVGLSGIERWLKNCGLTWFDLEQKGLIVFLLHEKCHPL